MNSLAVALFGLTLFAAGYYLILAFDMLLEAAKALQKKPA